MISFNFNLRNPWSKEFKNLWWKAYDTPFKNKFVDLEIYKDSSIIALNLSWTIRQSHAGLDIELGLFGYNIHFNFYDNRHWNIKEGRWMIYTEELGDH
jgi:hypothetical protein